MYSRLKKIASAATAIALIVTPTMASAAQAGTPQPVNPLIVVSALGSPASSQVAYPLAASAASSAAAAEGGDSGPLGTDYGINWILLGLGSFFFLAGLYTLFDDDDDGGRQLPVSPN